MFQFPSNGKVEPKLIHTWHMTQFQFQFPSNGKVEPKSEKKTIGRFGRYWVSIPFKRESVAKDDLSKIYDGETYSFNSLQTGKWRQRLHQPISHAIRTGVSIPFKRESVAKVYMLVANVLAIVLFQFPSNGKVEPKSVTTPRNMTEATMFQFPSNGKVEPKTEGRR